MDEERTQVTVEEWADKQLEAVAHEVERKARSTRKRRKVRGIFLKPGKDPSAWWIRWWCNYGHRHEERIGPKALAEEEVEKRRVGVKSKDYCLTKEREKKRNAKPTLFRDLSARYLEWAKDHKPRSLKFRKSALKHIDAALGGLALGEIDKPTLEAYQARRWGNGAADSTVNRELTVLSHVFKKAVEWRLATANPVVGLERRPEPQGRTRYLTQEQEERLLATLPERYRPVTLLAVNTGLRLGELRALTWRDIDLGPKPFLTILRAKSQRTETVPLNRQAVAVLKALERTEERVFPDLPSHLSDMFTRYATKAGLQEVTFHVVEGASRPRQSCG